VQSKKPVNSKSSKAPVVNSLTEISSTEPIPFEGGRGFSYIDESEYLKFLNPDDTFARLLLQCRLLSATHNACIKTKKNYCAGSGFQSIDEKDISDKIFLKWMPSMNARNQSLVKINKQIFDSHFTFGNTPIELVRFEIGRTRYLYIYVHNFLEWRLGKPNEDGISEFAIQSKLFLRDNTMLDPEDYERVKKLPIYNPLYKEKSASKYRSGINWLRDSRGVERTLIWYKEPYVGFTNYGLPSAVSSTIYQKLEYKGARHNLDNLDNNLIVSAVLALKGNLTQKEADRIGRKIINNHIGDGKRGRLSVVASEEGIEGSSIHNFDTQKEGSFKEADESWTQKIILANDWDAMLAGLIHANTLGKGTSFLTKIIEIKKNTVLIPAQKDLIDEVWRNILNISAKWLGTKIKADDIQIKNTIDISGLTDVDITPAVMVDEVREGKGLPALADKKKGNMLLGELKGNQMKGVYVKDTGKKNTTKETDV
jgi:hypothetical protein